MTEETVLDHTPETPRTRPSRLSTVIVVSFHIVIYALAVHFVLWLLPGFTGSDRFGVFSFLLAGFVFGLLNVFLRPLIVLFTGRLIIRSFGLFVVVINAILLSVMAWLDNWHVASVLTLLVGGLVIGIVLALLDALLGINRPFIHDADEHHWAWSALIKFSGNRSNQLIANLRFQQVYDCLLYTSRCV